MSKPTTVRLPEPLARELERTARARGLERGAYLRELVREGLRREREADTLRRYERGELSLGRAARLLDLDPVGFVDDLRRRGLWLNVGLEDWRDSTSIRPAPTRRRRATGARARRGALG